MTPYDCRQSVVCIYGQTCERAPNSRIQSFINYTIYFRFQQQTTKIGHCVLNAYETRELTLVTKVDEQIRLIPVSIPGYLLHGMK